MATLQSGKCFTVPTFFGMCCRSEWQERMYIYKWHEVDQRKHEIFCVHIVCNEIQVKVNLKITTFFFYLRFPYCPNFFWFGVVPAKPVWLLLANHIFTLCYTWHFPWRADKIRLIFQTALAFRMYGLYMYGMFMCFIFSLSVLFSVNLVTCLNSWAAL